jgi:hypothetical protein
VDEDPDLCPLDAVRLTPLMDIMGGQPEILIGRIGGLPFLNCFRLADLHILRGSRELWAWVDLAQTAELPGY